MKLGVFVGEHGNGTFLIDIFADWTARYKLNVFKERTFQTPIFSGRINRWAFKQSFESIMKWSEVNFFEWASELLEYASHLQKRSPIVTRLHSFELYTWAPRINWGNVDKIILVSHAMEKKFASLYPEAASNTTVVYSGKKLDVFIPAYRSFQFDIGMLCGISPVKRVYEMVIILYELHQLGYRPHLHIGGGISKGGESERYYNAILHLIRNLGLKDYVTFYGHVAEPQIWLQNIDIFISNSYWEGMQNALIEAMATGCCCFAHNWDGSDEALPTEFISKTDHELKEKIIAYAELSEREKRDKQEMFREIAVKKFDIKEKFQEFQTIFSEVVSNNRK